MAWAYMKHSSYAKGSTETTTLLRLEADLMVVRNLVSRRGWPPKLIGQVLSHEDGLVEREVDFQSSGSIVASPGTAGRRWAWLRAGSRWSKGNQQPGLQRLR
jgi:hypothetical protein